MNIHFVVVAAVVFGVMLFAVAIGLGYKESALLFGAIAVISAPLVIHRIPHNNLAIGMLVGLAFFASYPMQKHLQIDNLLYRIFVQIGYFVVLWVIGLGWKRSWR